MPLALPYLRARLLTAYMLHTVAPGGMGTGLVRGMHTLPLDSKTTRQQLFSCAWPVQAKGNDDHSDCARNRMSV